MAAASVRERYGARLEILDGPLDRLHRLGLDVPRDQDLRADDAARCSRPGCGSCSPALLLAAILAASRGRRCGSRGARRVAAAGLGVALLGCGVGVVTVAETRIDSSVAAMIAGSVPLQVIIWRTLARERIATATTAQRRRRLSRASR